MTFGKNAIKLPTIWEIKAVFHKTFESELKTTTIPKSCIGKYYISILVEEGKKLPIKQVSSESKTIDIDVEIKDFVVMSNGEKVENPKYLKNSLNRLKVF